MSLRKQRSVKDFCFLQIFFLNLKVILKVRFSHLHRGTLELCQSDHRVLGTSLTKPLLPLFLSLARQPALERVLVVPNFFHLRMMEATVFLGTFNAAEMFWYTSPDLCLDTILFSELYGQILWPNGFDFALTCTVNCGTLYRQVCLSKSCPINWIYHRWTPIKL